MGIAGFCNFVLDSRSLFLYIIYYRASFVAVFFVSIDLHKESGTGQISSRYPKVIRKIL